MADYTGQVIDESKRLFEAPSTSTRSNTYVECSAEITMLREIALLYLL